MNIFRKLLMLFLLIILVALSFLPASAYALSDAAPVEITEWEMMWETEPGRTSGEVARDSEAEWMALSQGDQLPVKPDNIQAAWLRFRLPEYDLARPALNISKLTSNDISIFIEGKLVYESQRKFQYNKNEILLSLNDSESERMVYVFLHTESDWLGIKGKVKIGEYHTLRKSFMKHEMLDVILGTALLFLASAMYICTLFLNRAYLVGWSSLSTIILSVGLIIITYSPYLHIFYESYESLYFYLFELGSLLLMPSILLFFETIFGKGPFGIITLLRKIQVAVLIFSVLLFLLQLVWSRVENIYAMATIITFGSSVVVVNSILFLTLLKYCFSRNKEALIITIGFGIFCFIGVSEMAWYFILEMNYDIFIWKWGILGFLGSLVIILIRKILQNYDQVLKYSKQLEMFNNELQRSEKMEIISQLAASVAHEVRNPLQVTRGFLQLLRDKSPNEKDKGFMVLAIDELDRASEIITDFLTFAKPQLEQITFLDVAEELKQIEGILAPLATMQGAIMTFELTTDVFVRGNSSKLKQALINIIKNSIEALNNDGAVSIKSYTDELDDVIICIKDNGEGMHESDLKRLGEPYYSKKTKGTGLGLMVTFRIIETMQGKLEFRSVKGVGTEVFIHLPSAKKSPIAQ